MKKTLFLSAILGAALCSTTIAATESITINGTNYDAVAITAAQQANPDTNANAYLMNYNVTGNTATYHANGNTNAWIASLTSADTLVFAGTASGAHNAFFDTGNNGHVTINANIIAGGREDNDLRFWTNGTSATSKKVILNGNVIINGSQLNVYMQNGLTEINGKLLAGEGQVFHMTQNSGGTVAVKGAGSLADFNGTMKVDGGTLQLDSLITGLQLKGGSVATFTSGKLNSLTATQPLTLVSNATFGNLNVLADGAERLAVIKAGNSITLQAGSEKTFSSLSTTGSNGGWIFAEGIGDVQNSLYTDITLNGTGTTDNGFILKNANTTVHIGALAGTAKNTTIRGDWGNNGGRVLAIHQNTDTTFNGEFIDKSERSIALTKYGTGTLTLTAANGSTQALTIKEGGVTFTESASWGGNIILDGGALNLLLNSDNVTAVAGEHATSGNGFVTATYVKNYGTKLTKTENGGTATINGLTATVDNGAVSMSTDTSIYYINEAAESYSVGSAKEVFVNTDITYSGDAFTALERLTINGSHVSTARDNGTGLTKGDIVITAGGTLSVTGSGKDAFGYNGNSTKSITLKGTDAEHKAVLDLSFNDKNGTATMSANLIMSGFAEISGTRGFNTYHFDDTRAGNIIVSGTDNVISSQLAVRRNADVTVNNGGSLLISGTITAGADATGTLTKKGAGTLTITGNILGGNLTGNGVANTIIMNNTISGGSFQNLLIKDNTVSGGTFQNVTLRNASLTGGTYQSVTFDGSTVDGDITLNNTTGAGTLKTVLTGLNAGGAGTINMAGGEFSLTSDQNVNGLHLKTTGDTLNAINGHGYDSDGYTFTLSNGASFTVGNTRGLQIESKAVVDVLDGSLNANGEIVLGHNQPNSGEYKGTLKMEGGSITAALIRKNTTNSGNTSFSDTDNSFTMSGGTLTFTQGESNAISGVAATITGGTLSTAEAAWTIDNANASIGGVTISGANNATLANVTLTGAITALTGVTFEGAINYTGNGTTVTVESFTGTESGFGINTTTTTYKVLSDASTVSAQNNATWTLNGNAIDYVDGALTTVSTADSNVWHIVGAAKLADVTASGVSKVSVGADSVLTISGAYDKNSKSIDNSAGGTLLVNGMEGYFHESASVGNIKVGENGVTINNGYSRGENQATTIADIDAVEGATITFSGTYGATDMFHVTGTVSENLNIVNERTSDNGTTMIFDNALSINSITADSGLLKLKADSVTVNTLTFGGGTLDIRDAGAAETTITTTVLNVNADSTLNADLVTTAGSTLYFGGVLTMGSSVEFGDGTIIIVSDAIASQIANGDIVTLIDSIDADTDITSLTGVGIYTGSQETGLVYITDTHVLTHEDGTLYVATPEPATTTLSLLALAGLCARRKRR